MDTFLAIASKRDTRRYSDRPVPADAERRILDQGRLRGAKVMLEPAALTV